MKSTARVGTHPIHPMLIPFPFVFLTAAAGFQCVGRWRRRADLWQTGATLRRLGLLSGVVAAVPGLLDLLTVVPRVAGATSTALLHLTSNASALACFVLAEQADTGRAEEGGTALSLQAAGLAGLSLGGVLGGTLVYDHGIGVVEQAPIAGRESGAGRELDRSVADVGSVLAETEVHEGTATRA